MSVWVFGATPISIGHSSCQFSLSFRGCTYIDWSFPCQLEFLGLHLYQFVISMSFWVFGAALISINHLLISLCSVWVFGTAPISIDHRFVNLNLEFGTAPILIGHSSCQFSLSFRGRTYIDRPSSCQFVFSLSFWDRTYIDRSFILLV